MITARHAMRIRPTDVLPARCNFRRFPLPVSHVHPPVSVGRTALLLLVLASVAAGAALGAVWVATINLPGLS